MLAKRSKVLRPNSCAASSMLRWIFARLASTEFSPMAMKRTHVRKRQGDQGAGQNQAGGDPEVLLQPRIQRVVQPCEGQQHATAMMTPGTA